MTYKNVINTFKSTPFVRPTKGYHWDKVIIVVYPNVPGDLPHKNIVLKL